MISLASKICIKLHHNPRLDLLLGEHLFSQLSFLLAPLLSFLPLELLFRGKTGRFGSWQFRWRAQQHKAQLLE